jgi:hypothetical protein
LAARLLAINSQLARTHFVEASRLEYIRKKPQFNVCFSRLLSKTGLSAPPNIPVTLHHF